MTQSFQTGWLPPVICPQCGAELSPALLACPACRRLVHGERLNQLANEAKAAADANDLTAALQKWRAALELLPPDSRQHETIKAKVAELTREVDAQAVTKLAGPRPDAAPAASAGSKSGSAVTRTLGAGGALALLVWKFKFILAFVITKGKLLLLGLANSTTFLSMLLSLGVYWTAFGWKFALGLVLSIYVHEMGHVAMLVRYGVRATPPMFIPGFGALIRLKQYPADPREEARIGLAGPIWGLGAAAVAYAAYLGTGWAVMGAIAEWGARINLFNLTPVWQLDGSHAFRALTRRQRWLVVAAATVMAVVSPNWGDRIVLGLVIAFGALRTWADPDEGPGDRWTVYWFLALIAALSALAMLRVPVPAR